MSCTRVIAYRHVVLSAARRGLRISMAMSAPESRRFDASSTPALFVDALTSRSNTVHRTMSATATGSSLRRVGRCTCTLQPGRLPKRERRTGNVILHVKVTKPFYNFTVK
eukprot:4781535-Prymnesium_polylepis.1